MISSLIEEIHSLIMVLLMDIDLSTNSHNDSSIVKICLIMFDVYPSELHVFFQANLFIPSLLCLIQIKMSNTLLRNH